MKKSALAHFVSRNAPALVGVAAWLCLPLIFDNSYAQSLLVVVGMWLITVIGYNIVVGNAGQFSFGHGAFVGIGAYVTCVLYSLLGLNYVLSLLIALVVTGLAGALLALVAVRLATFYFAIATIAFHLIFYSYVTRSPLVRGEIGFKVERPPIGGFILDSDLKYFYLVSIIALILLLFAKNLIASKYGRALKAVHEDEVAAATTGIDVARAKLSVFILSAVLAAITGGLMAPYLGYLSPQAYAPSLSFTIFMMVIIGGPGSIWGSVLGTAFVVLLPEAIRLLGSLSFVPPDVNGILTNDLIRQLLFSVILFFCIVYLPKGIAGVFRPLRR